MEILIVGLARNLERKITKNIAHLSKTFKRLGKVGFYVVESDSKDLTTLKLENLELRIPEFSFVSLGNLESQLPNRIERLQFCRNNYVSHIRQMAIQPDFVCVADLDGINNKLNWSSVRSCFSSSINWDMCSANQSFGYFDIFALRKMNWCEQDVFEELEHLRKEKTGKESDFQLRTKAIYSKMIRIPRKSPWIEVDSAFGGLAIYRTKAFLEEDYSTPDGFNSNQCEHVYFHHKLKKRGYNLYVNPRLINSNVNEHNIRKLKIIRVTHQFLRRLKLRTRFVV